MLPCLLVFYLKNPLNASEYCLSVIQISGWTFAPATELHYGESGTCAEATMLLSGGDGGGGSVNQRRE